MAGDEEVMPHKPEIGIIEKGIQQGRHLMAECDNLMPRQSA
jgi:hypothetical protein